jgi:hypothetical protein
MAASTDSATVAVASILEEVISVLLVAGVFGRLVGMAERVKGYARVEPVCSGRRAAQA